MGSVSSWTILEMHRKQGIWEGHWLQQLRDDAKLLISWGVLWYYLSQDKSMCIIQQMKMSMKRTQVWNLFALIRSKSNFIYLLLFPISIVYVIPSICVYNIYKISYITYLSSTIQNEIMSKKNTQAVILVHILKYISFLQNSAFK